MAWWLVVISMLSAHGSHRSDSVWRVRSKYGLVSGSVVFEARDLRIYGRNDDGYSLKQVSERFSITADGEPCELEGAQVTQLGTRLRFAASWMCKNRADDYDIDLKGLSLLDPSHKHKAKIDDGKTVTTHTMTPDKTGIAFTESSLTISARIVDELEQYHDSVSAIATEQGEVPLSWWGFAAWGSVLFGILAWIIHRGRSKSRAPPQSTNPSPEQDVPDGGADSPSEAPLDSSLEAPSGQPPDVSLEALPDAKSDGTVPEPRVKQDEDAAP